MALCRAAARATATHLGFSRYIAGNAQGKRFLFVWCEAVTCPSNLTNVFAFDDDYPMGVLTSSAHRAWAMSEGSTLRVDLRYTPTSCFDPFPWPQPPAETQAEIGEISARLIERRQAICLDLEIGLTDLYNQVDDGAWQELRQLHRELDSAVLGAYGWPASIAGNRLELKTPGRTAWRAHGGQRRLLPVRYVNPARGMYPFRTFSGLSKNGDPHPETKKPAL